MAANGTILIMITAVCFGLAAPAAKIAYSEGASPIFALAVRFSMAALVLWAYNIFFGRREKLSVTKRQLILLFFTGGIVYFLTTMLYYNAILYIPVSLHVMVFYIYPTLINIFSVTVLKEKISSRQVLSLAIGFLGIAMMVWSPGILINWFGIMLSFLAALGNGSYVLMVGNKNIEGLDSITVTTYITTFAAASFIVSGIFTNQLMLNVSIKGFLAIMFVAVFSTVVATITLYLGVKKIGAARASIISTFEPVVGAFLSILLLNEKFIPLQIVGAVFVILAVVLVNIKKSDPVQCVSETAVHKP